MLYFVCGALIGGIYSRIPMGFNLGATFLGLIVIIFLSGRFYKLFAIALGYIWHQIFCYENLIVGCDDYFWFLCSIDGSRDVGFKILDVSWMGPVAGMLRVKLQLACLNWHPLWGQLALGMLCGSSPDSRGYFYRLYKDLGLLHMLVISGSHFSFISNLLDALLLFPAKILFAFRFIRHRFFLDITFLSEITALLLMCIYGQVVCWSPPCQRAFLMNTVHVLMRWKTKKRTASYEQEIVAFLQVLIFPMSFLTLSNILTWSCAFAVSYSNQAVECNKKIRFIFQDFFISLICFSYFGFISPIGIFVNSLLRNYGDLLLITTIFGISERMLNMEGFTHPFLSFVHICLNILFDIEFTVWNGTRIGIIGKYSLFFRSVVWIWFMVLFIGIVKAMKIREKEFQV